MLKTMAREAPQTYLLIIIVEVDFVFYLHEIFVLLRKFLEKTKKVIPFYDQKGAEFVASDWVPSWIPSKEAFGAEIFVFYKFLKSSRPQLGFAVFGDINVHTSFEDEVNSVAFINLALIKDRFFWVAPDFFDQGQSPSQHQLAEVFWENLAVVEDHFVGLDKELLSQILRQLVDDFVFWVSFLI